MTDIAPPIVQSVAVDGRTASRTERPGTAEQVAELLRECTQDDTGVYPVGAGTHSRVGLTPSSVDVALSLRGLSGVLRYDPDDLVVSVGAGTSIAELAEVLGERRQWLPVDAPGGPAATIGGLLALGLSGPRSLGSPTLRDLLIGIRVAGTDGTVAGAGGMVVKNVSGLDMGRLHVGARGTLGVITSANFKVWPVPEIEATVIATFPGAREGLGEALQRAQAVRASMLRPVAADIVADQEAVRIAIRFEGRAPGVRRQRDEACELLGSGTVLEADESAGWWDDHMRRLGFRDDATTAIRLDGRPRDMVVDGLTIYDAIARGNDGSWRLAISPGTGRSWLHLDDASDEAVATLVAAIPPTTSVGMVAGSTATRAAHAASMTSQSRGVDRALREQFDRAGVLNRGRWPLG
ncbi:MAG TPA: FAD-binding oxidoreductase [Thermomicrobiales bacterium]|jgi:glycolate oxidase FAD binding subunit|nr:FAD-binding oxidoreductase [Thermomicrobiales bacterium]